MNLPECDVHGDFRHLIYSSFFFFSCWLSFLKTLQCSVSCGYGIQSRVVSCMGPSQPQPLSPLLCMHMPKPITIQSCSMGNCRDDRPVHSDRSLWPTYRAVPPSPTATSTILPNITTPIPATKPSQRSDLWQFFSDRSDLSQCCVSPDPCGQLLLEPSGTVDLRNVNGHCTVSIGRPLDEVIYIKVESGSLNCKLQSNFYQTWRIVRSTVYHARLQVRHCLSPGEYVLFFDRLALVRKCKQLTGAELTTRTNVLLVRQSLLTPGNGVMFTYTSQKNTKRSHHQGQNPSMFKNGGLRLLMLVHRDVSSLSRLWHSAVFTKWHLWESNNFPH